MKKIKYVLCFLLCLITLTLLCSCNVCLHLTMVKTDVPATCTTAGYTNYLCADCGYTYNDNIVEPMGHTYALTVTDPTCETGGYTTYTCDCGHSYISDHTDAQGHDFQFNTTIDATCTDQGYTYHKCDRCEYSYVDQVTNPKGHDLSDTVTAPTCTSEGFTTYECGNCSYTYVSDYTAALGHSLESSVTPPTCTDEGYTTYSCENCDYTYVSDHTRPHGHDFEDAATVTAPTCTEQGFTTYNCNNCEYYFISDFTEPTSHKYVPSVISELSCTSVGETQYTCDCGDSYTVTEGATGHDFTRLVTMPTLSDMGYTEYSCKNCEYNYIGDFRFYSDILPDGAYSSGDEVVAQGIDISQYNYDGIYAIDFASLKEAGIDFVIIKAGSSYRDGYTLGGIDPRFEQSYADAKAAGLDVGVYFYTYARSVDEIKYDAELLLTILAGKQFEYPIYLDLEDDSLADLSSRTLTEMCFEFFSVLQRAGYYTGLYVNNEWLEYKINTAEALAYFEIWYARYPESNDSEPVWNEYEYGANLGMWQYSDKGAFDAMPDIPFDLNFAYKDYPAIIKDGGFNGYESDVKFQDDGKQFVYVISGAINIRSTPDFDSSVNLIGTAYMGARFEVLEINPGYTKIMYNGRIAFITANTSYISFEMPIITTRQTGGLHKG